MDDRKTKIKFQSNVVVIVLSIAAGVIFLMSFFIADKESKNLLRIAGFGLILATILFRVFKGELAYKPTREEIEERMFGNQNAGEIEKVKGKLRV